MSSAPLLEEVGRENQVSNSIYSTTSSNYVILATFATLVILYILALFRKSERDKMLEKIPGPMKLPFLGNALQLLGSSDNILPILRTWFMKYGHRVHVRVAQTVFVSLSSAEDFEKVMSSTEHINKSYDYKFIHPWLGTGLLTSKGKKWFKHRKILTPAFHFRILESFMPIFNEQSSKLVKILRGEHMDQESFDVSPYIRRCALDIISETAMGKKINAQENKNSEYLKAIESMVGLIIHRGISPWFRPDFIWRFSPGGREEKRLLKILYGFTEKVIRERKIEVEMKIGNNKNPVSGETEETENIYFQTKRRLAFLDLLIEAQRNEENELTDLEIREEVDTFMFEGHDTSAASVSFTIFLLGCYLDSQTKVHEELDSIFGNDKNRPITSQDLVQMKFLEACIKETLRIFPSVPFIEREIISDLKLDSNVTLPGGITVVLSIHQLHRDPKYYSDAEVFQPERFLRENVVSNEKHAYAYAPFSAGPRNCIGQKFAMMEDKVMLADFFRHFKVESIEKQEDLILPAVVILRSKSGVKIKLMNRN